MNNPSYLPGPLERERLQGALQGQVRGDLIFDRVGRGQYATDASVYQVMPVGVLTPKDTNDIRVAMEVAREQGLSILPRGAGTSQNGQTVNTGLVLDNSRHFGELLELDVQNLRCTVRPGMVLDTLNALLKPHGLWFPVDVSTSSRATIGGMAGNNSCGQRSIVYGTMRHNVLSMDAILADGREQHFGIIDNSAGTGSAEDAFVSTLTGIGQSYADEVRQRFPSVLRRVGGYNLDALLGDCPPVETKADRQPEPLAHGNGEVNLAHLLVGSEGTLGFTTAIELKLSPIPKHRVLGVCHFPTFHHAMDAAQHLVQLGPSAVELVDATMIELARDIEVFRPTVEEFVRGEPAAILLVEFSAQTHDANLASLKQLAVCMGDLGFYWQGSGEQWGGVIEAISPALQTAIGEVRKSGLNIMMSMKKEGKPVSFVEDCAVELPHLAEYTAGLTDIFERHDTRGTWYAHASVGCLHVRPVLNLKLDTGLATMREICEEAFDLVLQYKGSNSGEHGDGISRAEFYPKMFGDKLVAGFTEIKHHFDPGNLFNPQRIIDPPRMNERALLRYHQDYKTSTLQPALDWSAWPEASHGLQAAVEMCNNNGACRKLQGGAMCPSYRVTRNETDVTRGRANALRLALSGQLQVEPRAPAGQGVSNVLASDELFDTLKLCVSCKACKRECPTGVDMARMKIEVQAARVRSGKASLHDRLVAWLPRYAPWMCKALWLANARNRLTSKWSLAGNWLERLTGFSATRALPEFRRDFFKDSTVPDDSRETPGQGRVLLWVDTFSRYFEPENVKAAVTVLSAAGFNVGVAKVMNSKGSRPLCCGRTFLSGGFMAQAREEMQRTIDSLLPEIEKGAVIVGLEPSCLLTLRDELPSVLPGEQATAVAERCFLLEEFLQQQLSTGQLELPLKSIDKTLHVHGHCHQKAFNQMGSVTQILELIPDARVKMIESSCCGMAGSFGYQAETVEVSRQMAELSLLPAVHAADDDSLIVADGTSCRHQIQDGSEREALHVARVLEMALN